jgi:hypothetical protein
MSFPLADTRVVAVPTSESAPERPRQGKLIAAAAAVILLLALAATAYFVLRGPDRTREQIPSVSVPPSSPTDNAAESAVKPPGHSDSQQVSEDKRKAAEAKRQSEQEAAAVEAQKKASEAKEKTEKKEPTSSTPEQNPKPALPAPAASPESTPERATAPGRDGCMLTTVLDANGQAVGGARVMVEGTMMRGRTGPKGHWQECGLAVGQSIRVLVFGPRGGVAGSQTVTVAPRTFVTIRLDKVIDKAPDGLPQVNPGRKRPFPQRP